MELWLSSSQAVVCLPLHSVPLRSLARPSTRPRMSGISAAPSGKLASKDRDADPPLLVLCSHATPDYSGSSGGIAEWSENITVIHFAHRHWRARPSRGYTALSSYLSLNATHAARQTRHSLPAMPPRRLKVRVGAVEFCWNLKSTNKMAVTIVLQVVI